jgi:hypothetical protein
LAFGEWRSPPRLKLSSSSRSSLRCDSVSLIGVSLDCSRFRPPTRDAAQQTLF